MNVLSATNLLLSRLPIDAIIQLLPQEDPLRQRRFDTSWVSTRVCNVLFDAQIVTVGDLGNYPEWRLFKLHNFGSVSHCELKSALIEMLFRLRGPIFVQIATLCLSDDFRPEELISSMAAINSRHMKEQASDAGDAGAIIIHPGHTVADEIMAISGAIMFLRRSSEDPFAKRSMEVVRARYGLNGKRHTLAEIGAHHAISRERVRQLLRRLPWRAESIRWATGTVSHLERLKEGLAQNEVNVHSRVSGDGLEDLLGPVLTLSNAARFYEDVFGLELLVDTTD